MADPPVYLDFNATAPLRPEARAALLAALDVAGNPSSVHRFGRAARRVVERAREQVAALAGAAPGQVVFTSGATEANALALRGLGAASVLASAVEHDSVLANAAGPRVPVGADGLVDLTALEALLAGTPGPVLLSLQAVNGETGIIQPVAEAAAVARRHGALVHCDAVQAAGRIPLSFAALGVDALTLSAHKLGGPQGAGALVVREGAALAPLLVGGAQEERRRAGTEAVAMLAGFGAAAEAAGQLGDRERLARLRDGLEARLVRSGAVVVGADGPRVANTGCVAMPGVPAETQVAALDLAGVAVSAGSACSSGKVRRSHVLAAMGLSDALAGSAIRISLGWSTTPEDVERCAEAWEALRARTGSRATAGRAAA